MPLSVINEPSSVFPIWTDYYYQYSSTINSNINFKYFIEYQEYNGTTWSTIDQFARFPDPDGTTTFNLRKYLSAKVESDYFLQNYNSANGLYADPLEKVFRLKISEEYAYQFPYGIFDSSGTQIGTGVSANSTKYYGIYDLKLTYTSAVVGDTHTPIFEVGSVVQIIDNSNPITNLASINGIYTILEVGINYIVVNGVYDESKTYYTGTVLWSDHRQIINPSTIYTSGTFYALNSCNENGNHIFSSLPDYYTLRTNSILLIPIIGFKTVNIYNGATLLLTAAGSSQGNYLLRYKLPSTAMTIYINVSDGSGTSIENKSIIVSDLCNPRFDRVDLYFLDRKGSFTPFYFDLMNIKTLNIVNNNYKSMDQYGRTNKYQIDTQVSEQYKLTTDWLSVEQAKLFEELVESAYLYMFYEGSSVPQKVLIVDKQFETKRIQTTRLLNYQITVEISKEKYIQQ
jgi:hypothetical protein